MGDNESLFMTSKCHGKLCLSVFCGLVCSILLLTALTMEKLLKAIYFHYSTVFLSDHQLVTLLSSGANYRHQGPISQKSKLGFNVSFNSQGHIGTVPQHCHLWDSNP